MANHAKRRIEGEKVEEAAEADRVNFTQGTTVLAPTKAQIDEYEQRIIARDKLIAERPGNGRVEIPTPEPAGPPRAILWSVKVRDGALVVGASPTEEIHPLGRDAGWDVIVQGPSVLIVPPPTNVPSTASLRGSAGEPSSGFADLAKAHGMPDGTHRKMRVAHELPRSAVIIRWLVSADLSGEQLA